MTEEQIKDGYDRLDSSLHPPMDAFDRVEKRMTLRRHRRWAGTAAGAALVAAAVGGYAAVSAGSSDDGRDGLVAVEPPSPSLVMTRPDGSTYEFEDLTIRCDPPRGAMGEGGTRDGSHVYLSSPMTMTGQRVDTPFVLIVAGVQDQPRSYMLPLVDADASAQGPPFTVFIADTEGAPDGNEVSSQESSTGTLRIVRASCDPTPVLELEVDLTLASEEQTEAGQAKQSLVLQGAVG